MNFYHEAYGILFIGYAINIMLLFYLGVDSRLQLNEMQIQTELIKLRLSFHSCNVVNFNESTSERGPSMVQQQGRDSGQCSQNGVASGANWPGQLFHIPL